MDQKVLLKHILSVRALDEYRSKDSYLDNLITILDKSMDQWQSVKGVYISNQVIHASKIEPIFRRRLATIPKESNVSTLDEKIQFRELKTALEKFVDYLKSNPLADIVTVTINCDRFHYDIKCGIADESPEVICVIKGPVIPENLLPHEGI